MTSIKKWLVQEDEKDNSILRKLLFNVNMRLYNNNTAYKELISTIINHMTTTLKQKYTDYPKVKGISGANVGIPFNIVIIKIKRKTKDAIVVFINPKCKKTENSKLHIVSSNCGSLCLKENISVERHDSIDLEYYNINGRLIHKYVDTQEVYTLQHEIDHNNGILITDHQNNRK